MKFSYNKLQSYIEDKLPSPEVLAEALSFHFAEVESVEKEGDDAILDIKILPDRAGYAKSYEGVALEVSAALGLKRVESLVPKIEYNESFSVNPDKIREALSIDISNEEIADVLGRLDIKVEQARDELKLLISSNRSDLQNWRDIPEEVARILGYDKIPANVPPQMKSSIKPDKIFYYSERIKNILVEKGFSEVYTYSLASKGNFYIEKSVASDKNYLRANLTDGISKSLELNAKNAEILGLDQIKIFEIGNVFCEGGEHVALTIGIKNVKKEVEKKKKAKDEIKETRDELFKILGIEANILCSADDSGGIISLNGETAGITNHVEGIMELELNKIVKVLPEPQSYEDLGCTDAADIHYKKFSLQPFIVRDVAVFVPDGIGSDEVWATIYNGLKKAEALELLQRYSLFDTFKKGGKTSFAFRIVFQAMDRTLTVEEANKVMEMANEEMKMRGWEV